MGKSFLLLQISQQIAYNHIAHVIYYFRCHWSMKKNAKYKCNNNLVLLLKTKIERVVREDGKMEREDGYCKRKKDIALFIYCTVLKLWWCYSPMVYIHSYSHSLTNILNAEM